MKRLRLFLGDSYTFFIILGLGLVLRVLYGFYIAPNFLPGDAHYYWEEARRLMQGQSLEFYWPPGLIFLLAPFTLFSKGSLIFSLLTWLLFVGGWEKAGLSFLPRWKVNLGHLFFAIYPAFVHQSMIPLSQLPIAVILLWSVYLFYNLKQSPFLLLGLLLGLMGLIRPATWVLLPLVFVGINYPKINIKSSFVLLLGLLMLPLGWEVFAYRQSGRWIKVNDANAYNLYLGNHPQAPHYRNWWLGSHEVSGNEEFQEFVRERDSIRSLEEGKKVHAFETKARYYIGADISTFFLRMAHRFRVFWSFDTLSGATLLTSGKKIGYAFILIDALFFVLLLGGLFAYISQSPPRLWAWLAAFHLLYGLPYLLAFSHPSYHFPLIPFLALPGLEILDKRPKWKGPTFLLLLIFLFIQIEWGLDLWARHG